jgi:hypothetical protein
MYILSLDEDRPRFSGWYGSVWDRPGSVARPPAPTKPCRLGRGDRRSEPHPPATDHDHACRDPEDEDLPPGDVDGQGRQTPQKASSKDEGRHGHSLKPRKVSLQNLARDANAHGMPAYDGDLRVRLPCQGEEWGAVYHRRDDINARRQVDCEAPMLVCPQMADESSTSHGGAGDYQRRGAVWVDVRLPAHVQRPTLGYDQAGNRRQVRGRVQRSRVSPLRPPESRCQRHRDRHDCNDETATSQHIQWREGRNRGPPAGGFADRHRPSLPRLE